MLLSLLYIIIGMRTIRTLKGSSLTFGVFWLMVHHRHFREIIQKCVNIKSVWLLCSFISTRNSTVGGQSLNDNIVTDLEIPY